MARSLSPFTRLTLLMSELKGNRIEDLADVTKCDLAHHMEHLPDEIEDVSQKEAAVQIGAQGMSLLSVIQSGDLVKAEDERKNLIASLRKLKDVM